MVSPSERKFDAAWFVRGEPETRREIASNSAGRIPSDRAANHESHKFVVWRFRSGHGHNEHQDALDKESMTS